MYLAVISSLCLETLHLGSCMGTLCQGSTTLQCALRFSSPTRLCTEVLKGYLELLNSMHCGCARDGSSRTEVFQGDGRPLP
jgi:hypothetical protein